MNYSKPVAMLMFALFAASCSKNDDYVGVSDYTTTVTGVRHWKGTHTGYFQQTKTDGTIVATAFSKTITDTTFDIGRTDVLTVTTFGLMLRYKITDPSIGNSRFDTTLPNSSPTFLQYEKATKKMNFEYHSIREWNAVSGHNYEDHYVLETL